MIIAIDASRAINERAGIGRYTRELIQKMIAIDRKNQYLLIFTYWRKNLQKEKLIAGFRRPNTKIKFLKIPGALKERIWRWQLPWFGSLLGGADVFFAPSFFEVNFGLKIPQVMTIHDLSTFIFPLQRGEEVSLRLSRRAIAAAKVTKKVIAVSCSTAKDAQKFLKIKREKVTVIYPGLSDFPKPAKNLPKGLEAKKFILFVGTIEPRKNLVGLFKAYALLPLEIQEKYPLVVSGAEGWNTGEIFQVFRNLKLDGKVKFLGFSSDAQLARLYKDAAVFIYPSLYEGFGLPILEALGNETPIITANISSMPEVAGQAALYIDPCQPIEMCRAIQEIIDHKNKVEELKNASKAQVQKFSWEKAARQTIRILEEVGRG